MGFLKKLRLVLTVLTNVLIKGREAGLWNEKHSHKGGKNDR